jgi:hypothetical protein
MAAGIPAPHGLDCKRTKKPRVLFQAIYAHLADSGEKILFRIRCTSVGELEAPGSSMHLGLVVQRFGTEKSRKEPRCSKQKDPRLIHKEKEWPERRLP